MKKLKQIKTRLFIAIICLISAIQPAYAADPAPKPPTITSTVPIIPKPDHQTGFEPEPGIESAEFSVKAQTYFMKVIAALTSGFLGAITAFALLMVIIGGIQMLTAYGDEEKLTASKKTIQWALIGLLIAILAYAIVDIINTLPFTQLNTGEEQVPIT